MTAAKSTNLNSTESANVNSTEINEDHINNPHDAPFPTGLSCLVTIARAHGIATDATQLLHDSESQPQGFQRVQSCMRLVIWVCSLSSAE